MMVIGDRENHTLRWEIVLLFLVVLLRERGSNGEFEGIERTI